VLFADKLNEIEETVKFGIEVKAHGILFNNFYTVDESNKNRAIYDDNKEFYEIKKEIDRKFSNKIGIQWCSTFPRRNSKRKCRLVFHHIEFDAKGNISPCCFAFPDGEKYSNILKDPNAWNNDFFKKLRESLLNSNLPVHPLCKDCSYLYENLYGI
jgi:radical SAM protein with 4Fe4S-binding SPASM domain